MGKGLKGKWRGLSFEQKLAVVVMPVLLAVLTGVALPQLNRLIDAQTGSSPSQPERPPGSSPSQPQGPPPPSERRSLAVVQVVVRNPEGRFRQGRDPAVSVRRRDSYPMAELTVHNFGSRRVVLTHAHFAVEDFVHVRICYGGGGLELAPPLGITLPARPRANTRVVSPPLHRQLAPDEAEVLRFRLSVDHAEPYESYVYLVRVSLLHDGSTRPASAEFLVSVPGEVNRAWLWTDETVKDADYVADSWGERAASCMDENTDGLRRLLQARAHRGADLARVERQLRQRATQ